MPEKFYMTFVFDDRYLYFVKGLKTTIILTLGSFLCGILLAFGLCALKRSKHKAVQAVVNVVCNFFVQIPSMVLLMIFVYIIFGSSGLNIIITVIIALTIKAAAFLSEIFFTAVETVDPGEVEAARTLGLSKRQTFFRVVFPQSLMTALPLFKNQFISTLQETLRGGLSCHYGSDPRLQYRDVSYAGRAIWSGLRLRHVSAHRICGAVFARPSGQKKTHRRLKRWSASKI